MILAEQATFWPEAVAVMFIALCLAVCFVFYRLTGGKWPDDEGDTDG